MLVIISLSPIIMGFVLLPVLGVFDKGKRSNYDYQRLTFFITAILWISIWIVQELRAYSISGTFSADTNFKAAALAGVFTLVFIIIRREPSPNDYVLEMALLWIFLVGVFEIIL